MTSMAGQFVINFRLKNVIYATQSGNTVPLTNFHCCDVCVKTTLNTTVKLLQMEYLIQGNSLNIFGLLILRFSALFFLSLTSTKVPVDTTTSR